MSIFALALLSACGGNVDNETADKYITKAQDIVTLLNDGKYGEVTQTFNSEMKAGLPESELMKLEPVIQESGEFETFDKASVEEKDGHFVVVLVANYSEDKRIYTISFNQESEVAGFFIK